MKNITEELNYYMQMENIQREILFSFNNDYFQKIINCISNKENYINVEPEIYRLYISRAISLLDLEFSFDLLIALFENECFKKNKIEILSILDFTADSFYHFDNSEKNFSLFCLLLEQADHKEDMDLIFFNEKVKFLFFESILEINKNQPEKILPYLYKENFNLALNTLDFITNSSFSKTLKDSNELFKVNQKIVDF